MHFTEADDKTGSQYQSQCQPLAHRLDSSSRAPGAARNTNVSTSPRKESDAQPVDTIDAPNPATIDAERADVASTSTLPSIDEFYPGFERTADSHADAPAAADPAPALPPLGEFYRGFARSVSPSSRPASPPTSSPLPLPPIDEFYPGFKRLAAHPDADALPPLRVLFHESHFASESTSNAHLASPSPGPLTDDAFCARAYPGGYAHPYPPSRAHPYAHAKTRRDAVTAAVEPPADPFYVNSAWWVLRPYAVPVVDVRHAHAPQPPTRTRRRIAPLPRRSAQRGVYDPTNVYKGKQREEETREVWRFGTHQSRREGEEAYAFGFRAAYAYPPSAAEARRGGG
ncbi:hypothetical protein B0H11DRAFT_1009582 [Mycena galericulata]|nr:hypothetical protein B0H11DRAFT_1009582 [Mycena galericulata]